MVSQLQVLNKIIATGDYSMVSMNNLGVEYFFDFRDEFLFIKNHYEYHHKVPDQLTFAEAFPNFKFVTVNEPNAYLLEQLYKDYNTSFLIERFNNIKNLLETDQTDKAVDYFLKSIDKLQTGSALTPTHLWKDVSRYDKYLQRQTKGYYSTGFPEIDKIIGGIDPENENLVIAARTGQGKTYLLLALAVYLAAQGLKVGIYEGEMTADKVGYRIDTLRGHISNTDLNRGNRYSQERYKKYIDEIQTAEGYGDIIVLTPSDIAGAPTVNVLRAFIEKEDLDVLLVDQYSLLEDTSHAKQSWERVGNIAKAIKQLQVEKQIPIIAVSQMNRTKNEDGEQDTTQVGLSDMIPQYATNLIMLDRDKESLDRLTVNFVKTRDGGSGNKLTYSVDWDTGVFRYIPDAKDGALTKEEAAETRSRFAKIPNIPLGGLNAGEAKI